MDILVQNMIHFSGAALSCKKRRSQPVLNRRILLPDTKLTDLDVEILDRIVFL